MKTEQKIIEEICKEQRTIKLIESEISDDGKWVCYHWSDGGITVFATCNLWVEQLDK